MIFNDRGRFDRRVVRDVVVAGFGRGRVRFGGVTVRGGFRRGGFMMVGVVAGVKIGRAHV